MCSRSSSGTVSSAGSSRGSTAQRRASRCSMSGGRTTSRRGRSRASWTQCATRSVHTSGLRARRVSSGRPISARRSASFSPAHRRFRRDRSVVHRGLHFARVRRSSSPDVAMVVATVLALGLLAAIGAATVYARGFAPPTNRPIRSDALSYYLYLPAALLDHDLSDRATLERDFGGEYRVADLVPRAHGYLDKHSPGEAILLLPFFAVGHVAAHASGSKTNGFSRPYQVAAVVGGVTYALLGLTILGFTLLRWFDRGVVTIALVALTFGTNLFHYATYDAVYSHVSSFGLVALVVNRTIGLGEVPRARTAAVLGAALGLLADVRLTNLTVALFPLVVLTWRFKGDLRRLVSLGTITVAAAALLYVPQVLYWYRITGHPFVNAYGGEPTLRPLHPHLLDVAFSVRKGLFFWALLLAIAVVCTW